MQKKNFTLAEVLITLGIVGVVAALTIPVLMAKIQEKILIQQFRQTYAMLQNSLKMMRANEEYIPQCHYGKVSGYVNNCTTFFPMFMKYIKTVNYCFNNAYTNRCIPKYKGFDQIYKEQNPNLDEETANVRINSQCPGFIENKILTGRAYVTSNNKIIIPYDSGSSPLFLVDINGKDKPNKWGHDLFVFNFYYDEKEGNIILVDNKACNFITEDSGKTTSQMVRYVIDNGK